MPAKRKTRAKATPEAEKSRAGSGGAQKKRTASPKGRGILVIVESPAKASTIKKYLGQGFEVKASIGHVKDLPKASIGIDLKHDFRPAYVVIDAKKRIIAEIKAAAKRAAQVLLAPDPDREGEAIAWHIADEIRPCNGSIHRVLFNEITRKAVLEAIAHPVELDRNKYDSQQARRVLDRLVGYQISPILWAKVRRGLSAGRVQSVAVRLLAEREEEIKAFRSEEYWTVEFDVEGERPPAFVARVTRLDGEKPTLVHEGQAQEIVELARQSPLQVAAVERKERRKNPPPPFVTSRLQQEASSKLRFSPKRTMALAQRLYEGVELGAEGPTGLITYMRTDSTRVSEDAVAAVRDLIGSRFSPAHLPAEPNVYKTKKSAQDAHEAIRPTLLDHDPERVRILLTDNGGGRDAREIDDLVKLYTLIWNRFLACQMAPAVFEQTAIDITACRVGLRASGQVMRFPGFLDVYAESQEDTVAEDESIGSLPEVREGERLRLLGARPEQHFTQPPPRYSEATLIRDLEEKGIGRPSTYAAILSTVQDRGYVEKREGRLAPTELGVVVNGLLVKSFPDILNADFTAQMEERLDLVEEGTADWKRLLRDFYEPFERDLVRAKVEMRDLKREEEPTEEICDKCGKPMVIKWGRNGYFLACSGYPGCRNTKEYTRNPDGSLTILPATRPSDQICPACNSPMVVRRGRFGEFLACSRYPECKTTSPMPLGVDCPRQGCGGYLTEKRSKRGKVFYGCSNYTKSKCDFVSWDRPVPKPCPKCGAPFVVQKVTRSGVRLRCIAEGCGWTAASEDSDLEQAS
ncbi:MAG: type I DNA topoisomerase [Deltaproteobacteria bacterium]|nr:type I DNA topoisomerase [Deltaproteobacteria bacterium]